MKISRNKIMLAMLKAEIPTQGELAKRAGLTANTITALLRGAKPKLETMQKLAAALMVDPVELLEDAP